VPGLALTVGELTGFLRIDSSGWRRGLGRAHREFDGFSRDTDGRLRDLRGRFVAEGESAGRGFAAGLSRETRTITRTADRAAAGFVRLALAMSNVVTAGTAIHGVASTVTALGAAVAVLPAAGVAAGVGLAAARVGMSGFGEAMRNAGDPAAFAASLERLSPAARETAVAVRDLGPAWRSMQQVTQEALFAGVADEVRELGGRYLPLLESGLVGVAGEMNRAVGSIGAFLGESRQVATVAGIFEQVRASAGEAGGALTPLVSILLDLVAVGSEFLPGLAGGFADATQRAAEFIREARETGQLHEWIASGLATLRQLGQLLANVGGIASAVFDGLGLGGAGLLGTLVALTGQVRAFLESVEGQRALAAFGEVLATVSDVVGEVFLTALQQLAPVAAALAPGFAELTTQVGADLVAALTLAGPLLTQLATVLSQNAYWLGPLIIGLYSGVKAFEAITAAVKLFTAASNLNPWVAIISATIALATLIITNWDQITSAVRAAWQWLSDGAAEVWGWIEHNILRHLGNIVGSVETGARTILDIVAWLAALPDKVGAWFGSMRDRAIRRLGELVAWVRGLPGAIVRALGDLGPRMAEAGRDIVLGLLRGLRDFAHKIWEWITDIAEEVWNRVTDVFGIASPSKKMRWAGQMIGLGLASGMDAMTGTVSSSAAALAGAGAVTVPAPVITAPRNVAATAPSGAPAAPTPPSTPDPAGRDREALVHIEHYHPPADATPGQVAAELDWMLRAGGR
jgi:hypothetical protein